MVQATAPKKGIVKRILDRALARREGRRYSEDGGESVAPEAIEKQPDYLREAIESGDVTLEDIPVSTKYEEVRTNVPETSWREAGPSDLDALRAKSQGHRYVDPQTVARMDKQQQKDPAFEAGYAAAETDRRRAEDEQRYERDEHGNVRRDRYGQGIPLRLVKVAPLPARDSELMGETEGDARVRPGQPVAGGRVRVEAEPGASVLRDSTEEQLRQLDGGVRRAPAPE